MPAKQSSQRAVDYVEVLYDLLFPVGEYRPSEAAAPIAARIADRLGVSRASVSEMLRRLADQGLIERGPGRTLNLTSDGIDLAESGVRATRVLESFLVGFMDYAPAEVHGLAIGLRETFTPAMIDRLHERLGSPERCPHGWPIGAGAGRSEAGGLHRLIELQRGAAATVVSVVEDDPELIAWLFGAGLTPGAAFTVQDVQPAAGQLTVAVTGAGAVAVADRAARTVFVSSR